MIAPRLVFFSGGTALRDFCQLLAVENPNTIHIITTFDSGGSTAQLRKSFAIPAIGDIRNRLLALADPRLVPREVIALMNMRFGANSSEARQEILEFAHSTAPVWKNIPADYKSVLVRCLNLFIEKLPSTFDAAGANMGNIMLVGAYLHFNRDFSTLLNFFHNFLHTRGMIRPIVDSNLHLAAQLENGQTIIGQHLFKNLPSPVKSLFLTVHESVRTLNADHTPADCHPSIAADVSEFIRDGDAIVYPMGSFYSSLIANLVPHGVGKAIGQNQGKKIFIPNSGRDPELAGMDIAEQAQLLLSILRKDSRGGENFLQYILIDSKHGRYPGGYTKAIADKLTAMGIQIVDQDIVIETDPSKHATAPLYRSIMTILTGL